MKAAARPATAKSGEFPAFFNAINNESGGVSMNGLTQNGAATRREFLKRTALIWGALATANGVGASDWKRIFAAEFTDGPEPTADEIDAAIRVLSETAGPKWSDERLKAALTIQRSVDRLEAKEFKVFTLDVFFHTNQRISTTATTAS
jgi:hypothetical protein